MVAPRPSVKTALICLLDLAIALESFVVVMLVDDAALDADSDDAAAVRRNAVDRLKLPAALLTLWVALQYAAFGASITFAGAVWIARSSRALVLLTNALLFALYALQWLALAACSLLSDDSSAGALFAALAAHPLLGFLLSRSAGRQARDEAERQEVLDIVRGHEEEFLYHSADV